MGLGEGKFWKPGVSNVSRVGSARTLGSIFTERIVRFSEIVQNFKNRVMQNSCRNRDFVQLTAAKVVVSKIEAQDNVSLLQGDVVSYPVLPQTCGCHNGDATPPEA